MQRFFIDYKEISNKFVTFDEKQSKKIRKVLRMKVEDKVIAFDNKGWEYDVILTKITNAYSLGKIVDRRLNQELTHKTLVQALPKNLKTEFILQKCTELGVDRIIFFESEFSQIDAKRISEDKIKRWRRIATEAAEQCGRVFVPHIDLFTVCFEDLIDILVAQEIFNGVDDYPIIYLDLSGSSMLDAKNELDLAKIHFFIGPEGGFSVKEKEIFLSKGVRPIKISQTILRSETAGMSFLSQVNLLS